MELKSFFAQDPQGNMYPAATCELLLAGTANRASNLVDGAGKPMANPFTSHSSGLIQFAAPNGLYDLKVTAGAMSYTLRVQCYDAKDDTGALTNTLTQCRFGRLSPQALTQDYTTQSITELESEFLSLRIGIPNIHTAAVAGVRVMVGVMDSHTAAAWLIDSNPNGAGWQLCTFNGQSTATLPAQLGEERWSVTWTDPVELTNLPRTDGSRRPLVIVRIEFPNGAVISCPTNGLASWRSDNQVRYHKAGRQMGVKGVSTPSSFTETLSRENECVIPLIQYSTEKAGRQFLIVGDSTVEGVGSQPSCYGAAQRVAHRHSTPDRPIEYFNAAIHANPPRIYAQRVGDLMHTVRPTHVVYSPYSGNDVQPTGMTEQAQTRLKVFLGEVLRYIHLSGVHPKVTLLEGLPTTPGYKNTGANDKIRVDLNTYLQRVTGAKAAVGYAAAVSGPKLESGQIPMLANLTNDGVHPNPAGYELLADNLEKYINLPLGMP